MSDSLEILKITNYSIWTTSGFQTKCDVTNHPRVLNSKILKVSTEKLPVQQINVKTDF